MKTPNENSTNAYRELYGVVWDCPVTHPNSVHISASRDPDTVLMTTAVLRSPWNYRFTLRDDTKVCDFEVSVDGEDASRFAEEVNEWETEIRLRGRQSTAREQAKKAMQDPQNLTIEDIKTAVTEALREWRPEVQMSGREFFGTMGHDRQ